MMTGWYYHLWNPPFVEFDGEQMENNGVFFRRSDDMVVFLDDDIRMDFSLGVGRVLEL